ncbi:MAG: hypothetical protein R3246_12015 [Acidimicrobiia bacterium]|nr:hypothetical protein [Acidimicrobiia bacterium]
MQDEHPDLVEIDRAIRSNLDRVLRAEQEAAELVRRRSATLRDRLLDFEDRGDSVVVMQLDGREIAGVVDSVGADHVDLLTSSGLVLLPLTGLTGVRVL